MQPYGHFIGGREVPAKESFEDLNPYTGDIFSLAARGDADDANAAVEAAREAFPIWSQLPPAEREKVMLNAADLLEENLELLREIIIDESGSTITKARGEVLYSASLMRAAAGESRRLYGETFPNDKPHRLSMVIREPMGVIAAISPFNAPLSLLVKMIAFALAAGNSVVSKPSEETPVVAVEFAKILHQAGVTPGAYNVVTGFGSDLGGALVEHPQVNGIAFTGSTSTGVRIAQSAVKSMKRMQMELGGKNPLIVLKDVDIEKAAEIAAVGAFFHGGQICMSSARIIVEEEIARPFAEALAKKAASLPLGDLRDPKTAYGPVINQRSLDKIQAHVDSARAEGAEILSGGEVHHGLVFKPTVIWEPPRTCAAWCEETFGPVTAIVSAKDFDEAIEIANESDYGLSAGILTNDMQRGLSAARRIHCGAVHIGMHSFQSDAMAPVGGIGMSGFGRSGGHYSVEHFTELKWISMELGETPNPF
ncbi:MAG: aldehyde dehydrogenase family protein [Chloroflexi bacterium]|nr:aldehyde dehydrogenase family protein [Chloroflexota bacterium]